MVAIIKTGHSIRRTFLYNENKLKTGAATLLHAQNYPLNVDQLTANQRLHMLLHQAALNTSVSRNSLHVSLNFDPKEKVDDVKLRLIAERYMEGIGYGAQPYLVYRHTDAGHPHIHIVSINVRPDGSRIDTFNIGRNQSETARRIIEQDFSLIKASRKRGARQEHALKPVDTQKVSYGKTETKRAITVVLEQVLAGYKCGSLTELNAVLKLFNVTADRGAENSRTYKSGGLVYRVLDEVGNKVGVPVKASLLYNKPTLRFLETYFTKSQIARRPFKAGLINRIDQALVTLSSVSVEAFQQALQQQGIVLVPRKNAEGRIYGLTYIDTKNKIVFNGGDLGKGYSAKGLEDRLKQLMENIPAASSPAMVRMPGNTSVLNLKPFSSPDHAEPSTFPLLDALLQPETAPMTTPYELSALPKKKRRQRRQTKL